VNLKGSSTRAAESHLRAHVISKLGDYHLPEITTKIVQGFVAYLAGGGRSRKTAENILLTLSSLLKTARSWGYACGDFRFADLTLPREGVKAEPRSFMDDEVRRIIAGASEPLSTIVAVTAVLGLRIGETLALRTFDVDFAKHVIRVRQSVDAATRTICGVKSNASSADLPMSKELEARLQTHLHRHDHKNELLFVNGRGRPFSANKLREKQLHPLLDALGIPRGGFHSMRHGAASSLLADGATPAVVQAQLRHSDARITLGILRACCRRCTAQRGSESFDKTGQLRPIVRKPGFVRRPACNSLKTIWIGRGGGDRTQHPNVSFPRPISKSSHSHYPHRWNQPSGSAPRDSVRRISGLT